MSRLSHRVSGEGSVVALCGGVGGAKLALGLERVLGDRLTVVVNVADDFEHLGLHISPDLDTVLYTLGNQSDQQRGWGRSGEIWNFMEALKQVGGETWFLLGDRDLALHIERTRRKASGQSLTAIAADIARRFDIRAQALPVTDDRLRTLVITTEGELEFQRYFVEHRCEPVVNKIRFLGAQDVRMTAEVSRALEADDLHLIVICPSNPYLSVDPILAVPGLVDRIRAARIPVIAVSPIIGGQAVKGPTRKIMDELNLAATNAEIARHYAGLIDGLIVDTADAVEARDLGFAVHVAPTLMTESQSKIELATEVLTFAERLQEKGFSRARSVRRSAVTGGDAWIIVPAKSFVLAKRRLSSLLCDSERATLARAMLTDVLGAAAGTSGLRNIAVVTSSDDVAQDAMRLGALVINDGGASGTNDAIKAGLAAISQRGGQCVVILPSDVPAVLSEDLSGLLAAAKWGCMVIVPATRDGGTNALAIGRPEQLEPCFGPQSFGRHVNAANQIGIKPKVVLNERLGLDIDQPCDLFQFMDRKTTTATDRYLRSIDVSERRRNPAFTAAVADTSQREQNPKFLRLAI